MPYGRITPKQQEILDYIKNEILNRGFPPAVREICKIKYRGNQISSLRDT